MGTRVRVQYDHQRASRKQSCRSTTWHDRCDGPTMAWAPPFPLSALVSSFPMPLSTVSSIRQDGHHEPPAMMQYSKLQDAVTILQHESNRSQRSMQAPPPGAMPCTRR
nr:hypothetical protein CFP56_29891 [Quercus suber]